MIKYDKFELYMIKKLNEYGNKIDKEDNYAEANVFAELMETLYQYEYQKNEGDIIAY